MTYQAVFSDLSCTRLFLRVVDLQVSLINDFKRSVFHVKRSPFVEGDFLWPGVLVMLCGP